MRNDARKIIWLIHAGKQRSLNSMTTTNRVFFAIELTPDTKKSVSEIIEHLKIKDTQREIRWVKPDNLHITLQFIGNFNLTDTTPLLENAAHALQNINAFDLTFQTLETFSTKHHARIISLNMDQNEILGQLAKTLGSAITPLGYKVETRPFRAHLTLGRLENTEIDDAFIHIPLNSLNKIAIQEIVLFKSEPSGDGSKYTVLGKVKLGTIANN